MLRVFVVLIFLSGVSLADTHKLYKPQKVSGLATYKGSNVVGNVLYSLAHIDRRDTSPKLITKLAFIEGQGVPVFARAYLPATVGELLKSVGYETRNAKLEFVASFDDQSEDLSFSELRDEHSSWNAIGWDDRGKLAKLAPGTYKIIISAYLQFEVKKPNAAGALAWTSDSFVVASGELPLEVAKPVKRSTKK